MNIYDKIRLLIANKKTNITKVEKECELSQGSIKNSEQQNSIPNGKTILKIAKYFNVTTDYLLGLSEVPTHPPAQANIINGDIIHNPKAQNAITINENQSQAKQLSEITTEIINICEKLNIRQKAELLNYAYKIEKDKK